MWQRMVTAFCMMAGAAGVSFGAQDYPNKPIRLVVPYSAGGVTDTIARELANKMSEALKQHVIVENRTGAGGNIAAEAVARAPADGYTIFFGANGPLAANKTLYAKLNYDPEKDFSPITLLTSVPYLLAVHPKLGVEDLQGLIRLLKANPGKYTFASGGTGTAQHFAGEMFKSMAGLEIQHVAYKGEAPALNDLMGGHVPMLFASFTALLPHVKSNTLRALAVTSSKRLPQLPDVPTMSESGLSGYDIAPWFGLAGPAGMPPAVIEKIHATAVDALKSKEVQGRLASIGASTIGSSPQEFAAFIHSEIPRWAKLVRDSGARAD
ncbi:MAG: Bug family tripartite tricarboxylate transporter substrate binding protein [Noviherbaspirillum sp.]